MIGSIVLVPKKGAWAAFSTCLALSASVAWAAVDVIPLVQFGDLSPDGEGTFGSFLDYGAPCLNDASQVAFSADLSGNAGGTAADELMVRVEADGTVTLLAREGQAIPGGTGFYDNLKTPNRRYVINNDGRVAFVCEMTGTPAGTSDNQAIYSTDGPGTETLHVRIGDLAAGTTSSFVGLFPPTINNLSPVRVAFYAYVGSFGPHPGHIYSNRAGTSTLLAKITQPVPGDAGTLWQFDESQPPSIDPYGDDVAFRAQLTGTPWASEDDAAVYKSRGAGLVEVARGRQPVPGGGSNYDEFFYPVLNAFGNVAFRVVLRPTSDGEAIVIQGGDLDADLVAITNQMHPDEVSRFSSFFSPALSAGNVAAFRARLKDTPGGGLDDEGIYRGDGTVLIEVAREGQTVPEGGGEFATFGSIVAINSQAQVLFYATLRGTPFGSADNAGLYLWDEGAGLRKLVRKRDTVPESGGVVTAIYALSAVDTGGFRSLNDASEAVAILDLTGSLEKDGVYMFRVTDPTSAPMGGEIGPVTLVVSPNPWTRGSLSLRNTAAQASDTPLPVDVLDALGRSVARLQLSGEQVEWDGTDFHGRGLPGGVYFIRVSGVNPTRSLRVVRLIR